MGSFIVFIVCKTWAFDPAAILVVHMNRFYKILLLWLLVAMLPLHAVSAGMPVSCTPAHHQAMQKTMHDGAHHPHAMHHSDDAGMAMQDHHNGLNTLHHAGPDDSAADVPTSSAHPHAGCSACSAGCIGAAAPPLALQATPASSGSDAVLVTPAPLVTGYTPGALDRPPKYFLA